MRKTLFFLATIFSAFSLAISSKSTRAVLADGEDGYIVKNESTAVEDCFEVVTNSPWVSGAKWEISFTEITVNKAYIVLDYDVTLSLNNPELVTRLGLNGSYFTGHDGENFHGSNINIMKNWGDWFFLNPGRNQVYFPTEYFCSSITSANKFGLYFDTGFANRSGSSLNIYGLYQADTFDEELTTNYITPKSYQDHEDLITTVGANSRLSIDKVLDTVAGAWLYGDYVGALKMHVKSGGEGGQTIDNPNDYGYISLTLDTPVDVSGDEGFAFSAFAIDGETYFRIALEDSNGHIYMPALVGSPKEDAGTYPMIEDAIPVSILHFYGALYLDDKQSGTSYIPYEKFATTDYFLGASKAMSSSRIANIVKIHIGMDMLWGLGRNLVVNEFGTCDVDTMTVKSISQFSKLSETEWNRTNFSQSTKIAVNGAQIHKDNYVITAITEEQVPGAKAPVDPAELERAIQLAKSLNEKDYTAVTWAVLKTKLENAENLVQYSELYEQKDFDDATKALMKAIRGLQLDENASAEQPAENSEEPAKKGCSSSITATSALIFSLSITALLLLAIKRKEKYNHEK